MRMFRLAVSPAAKRNIDKNNYQCVCCMKNKEYIVPQIRIEEFVLEEGVATSPINPGQVEVEMFDNPETW